MEKRRCNGGIIDTIYAINSKLKDKYHRPETVVGFEKSEKGNNNLRFFDKDEKTIWLPQELYDKYNKYLVKNGALNKGKTIIIKKQTKPSFVDVCCKIFGRNR